MTTESKTVTWILVAGCRQCEHYLPLDHAGTPCPECPWILVKRRLYICYWCKGHDSFAARHDYHKHLEDEHED